MKIIRFTAFAKLKVIIVALVCAVTLSAHAADDKIKEQKKIRDVANKTLHRLYKAQPAAKPRSSTRPAMPCSITRE
jgi:hypothetical protein